jgi:hypothetical protein
MEAGCGIRHAGNVEDAANIFLDGLSASGAVSCSDRSRATAVVTQRRDVNSERVTDECCFGHRCRAKDPRPEGTR